MDCSPLGFFVHGISQTRILEKVAISFSRGSSWPRDQIHISLHRQEDSLTLSHQGNYYALCKIRLYLETTIKTWVCQLLWHVISFDHPMTTLKQNQVLLALFWWGNSIEHSMIHIDNRKDWMPSCCFLHWWPWLYAWVRWMVALEEAKLPSNRYGLIPQYRKHLTFISAPWISFQVFKCDFHGRSHVHSPLFVKRKLITFSSCISHKLFPRANKY